MIPDLLPVAIKLSSSLTSKAEISSLKWPPFAFLNKYDISGSSSSNIFTYESQDEVTSRI
jgi:hypothetical protein